MKPITLLFVTITFAILYYFSHVCLIIPDIRLYVPKAVPDTSCYNAVDDCITEANGDNFPVHLVRLYHTPPEPWKDSLCWTECLSVLSIIYFMKPRHIYLHTNFPDYWPFDTCDNLISNYSSIKIIGTRRFFQMGGRRLHPGRSFIAHEADLIKLYSLYRYGGMALDFDVYVLPNITFMVKALEEQYECFISREDDMKANIGFVGCRKNARFIRAIINSYETDYRQEWTYNSGNIPMILYNHDPLYRRTVFLDDQTARNPNITERNEMWDKKGVVNWLAKPAYHSFFHNCTFAEPDLMFSNTSLAELFEFIVVESRREAMAKLKSALNGSEIGPPLEPLPSGIAVF